MSPVPSAVVVEPTEPAPVTTTCRISAGTQLCDPLASHTPFVVVAVTGAATAGGAQSLLAWKPPPTGHCGQPPPPQSVSVSLPLMTPSVQLGAAHLPSLVARVIVDAHTPSAQSLLPRHDLPVVQPGHAPPPQSRSVSSPFFLRSPHVGATQTPQVAPPA